MIVDVRLRASISCFQLNNGPAYLIMPYYVPKIINTNNVMTLSTLPYLDIATNLPISISVLVEPFFLGGLVGGHLWILLQRSRAFKYVARITTSPFPFFFVSNKV